MVNIGFNGIAGGGDRQARTSQVMHVRSYSLRSATHVAESARSLANKLPAILRLLKHRTFHVLQWSQVLRYLVGGILSNTST
jgi:hypothetical protein